MAHRGRTSTPVDDRGGNSGPRQGCRLERMYTFYSLEFYDFSLPCLMFMGQHLDLKVFVSLLLSFSLDSNFFSRSQTSTFSLCAG